MNLFEFFVLVLATFCLSVVVFLLFTFLFPSTPRVVVITGSDVPTRWWPWSVTSYNHWPYWMGGGGDSSARRYPHEKRGEHRGSHSSRPWGGAQRGAEGGAPKPGGAPKH